MDDTGDGPGRDPNHSLKIFVDMVLGCPHPFTHVRPNPGYDWSSPQSRTCSGSRSITATSSKGFDLHGSLLSPRPLAGPMASPLSLMDQASP